MLIKNIFKIGFIFTASLLTIFSTVHSAENKMPLSASPKEAIVYIVSPKEGETVSQKFTVVFGLRGMGIAPAGVDAEHTGHHHLMVDQKGLPPMELPLSQEMVTHFGKGQTETQLDLKPGKHTLQLILGDKNHIPHNPPVVSKIVNITVK